MDVARKEEAKTVAVLFCPCRDRQGVGSSKSQEEINTPSTQLDERYDHGHY